MKACELRSSVTHRQAERKRQKASRKYSEDVSNRESSNIRAVIYGFTIFTVTSANETNYKKYRESESIAN